MKPKTIAAVLGAILLTLPFGARAAGDLSKQPPITVKVMLGSKKNNLAFSPSKLSFETGKLYKLVLTNPSSQKHYFTSLEFAAAVWTRKIQGSGMEVKGAIREIELLPGQSAEWFFVPIQTGRFLLYCRIPGHKERGMVGEITLK